MDEKSIEEMVDKTFDFAENRIMKNFMIQRKSELTRKILAIFHENGQDWFATTNTIVDFIYDYAIACDAYYEPELLEYQLLIEKIRRSEDCKKSVMINLLIDEFNQWLSQHDHSEDWEKLDEFLRT